MENRIYIEDFCYDLNYKQIILYIGNVDQDKLRRALDDSVVNKVYRLDYALEKDDPATKNYIFVENCDLYDLTWPIYEYIASDYKVHILQEENGKYFIEKNV